MIIKNFDLQKDYVNPNFIQKATKDSVYSEVIHYAKDQTPLTDSDVYAFS